jgi:predicted ATPase/class 3 adenylate cyclase
MQHANFATITFLFTDIEGSTRAWEMHPDAMAVALQEHNVILFEEIRRHGGSVFKTVGDAFCAAFDDQSKALTAAVEAQRRLTAHAWPSDVGEIRVRMALHTGMADHHDGDYFGPSLNRVARLTSIAHGGQILLSSAMAEALENVPQPGIALRDLGLHRLKDLRRAEATYQVVAEGLRVVFPELDSVDAHPNNLPSQISSFVGRSDELARLRRALEESRVVTVAGPGGIGKTRIALQLAADVVADFSGGVFFVPLAPVSGDLVVNALASALETTELPNEPLEVTLLRYIAAKHMLLVFDNCEHVLRQTAALVKRIVSECPNARCVVTGREPLHLTGERVERVAPLPTPRDAQTVAELEALDGSRLFLERMRAVGANVTLSARDCALVADICRRLEGIPLAIELAASRSATIPVRRLAEKLSVMRLASKDATVEDRHRTLRAAIEWSYTMLEAAEKRLFLTLSIFRGGCALEALEYVARHDVDDEIASLVDKSLAQLGIVEEREPRYRLLEPMLEFAALHLGEAAREALPRRHFEYYAGLASASNKASGSQRRPLFVRVDDEIDNVRAALPWSLEHDVARGARMVLDLTPYWRARGSFSEGRRWLGSLLPLLEQLEPMQRGVALRDAASFAAMQDDYEQAVELTQRALEIYRDLGDAARIGAALHVLAEVAHRQDRRDEAERLYREAFEQLDAADHLVGKTICLMNQGVLAREMGDVAASEAFLHAAAAAAERLDDRGVWAQIQIERAWTTLDLGNAQRAEELFRQALEAKTQECDAHGICQARLGRATALFACSKPELALPEFETALREAIAVGAQIFVIDAIYGIGAVCAVTGDLHAAAKCCGLAANLVEKTRCAARTGIVVTVAVERINAGLGDEERGLAMAAGASMRPEDVDSSLLSTLVRSPLTTGP